MFLALLALISCEPKDYEMGATQCVDGRDNDGDGKIDADDGDCYACGPNPAAQICEDAPEPVDPADDHSRWECDQVAMPGTTCNNVRLCCDNLEDADECEWRSNGEVYPCDGIDCDRANERLIDDCM